MHLLQTDTWREAKEEIGNKTYSFKGGWFQTTKIPKLNYSIGYVPHIDLNNLDVADLKIQAKKANCAYVLVEPDNQKGDPIIKKFSEYKKARNIHLPKTVLINLDRPFTEIFSQFKKKFRYYAKYGKKKGVEVRIESSDEAFEKFLKVYFETKKRQKFYGRNEDYLRKVWEVYKSSEIDKVKIVNAYFKDEVLVSWFVIINKSKAYYPYGGSIDKHRNLNATYTIVMEFLKWAQDKGIESFDFYGVEDNYKKDEGFSRFKVGFGGDLIEYAQPFEIVINPLLYPSVKLGMFLRDNLKFLKDRL